MNEATDPATSGPGRAVQAVRLTDEAVAGIETVARSLGHAFVHVELAGCNDKDGLLDRTARAFAFPEWFGRNWDAWFDCLTDLSGPPRVAGYAIVLRHCLRLQQAAPEVLDTALSILEDAATVWAGRGVPFRVYFDADGD